MKKILLLTGLIFATVTVYGGEASNDYKKYYLTDSVYTYKWSELQTDWVLNQLQSYVYYSGKLTELVTSDINSGNQIAKTVFRYNVFGQQDTAINFIYRDSWIRSTRSVFNYNNEGKIMSVRLQKWVQGAWIDDRLQGNYTYDSEGNLIRYESTYWRNNNWTLPTVNENFYNSSGQLALRIATRPDGNIDYQVTYEYSPDGLRSKIYTQYPSNNVMNNWNLQTYEYNGCGTTSSQILYTGDGTEWIPATKTVYFASFHFAGFRGKKVPVCHNGNTIYISINALDAHFRHGDCVGECIVEKEPERRDAENEKYHVRPFTIFPNPAKEYITIKFNDIDCTELKRVELTDFHGKLVRSYNININSDLTIYRGNLLSGKYYIRIAGKEVFSAMIIFE